MCTANLIIVHILKELNGVLADEAVKLKIHASHEDIYRNHKNGAIVAVHVHVAGVPHCVKNWVSMLRRSLQQCAEPGDKLRVVRDFEVENRHWSGFVSGAICLEPPYIDHKAWLGTVELSKEKTELLKGCHGREILDETRQEHSCVIDVVSGRTRLPHVSVLGDCARDVEICCIFVRTRLSELHKATSATKKREKRGRKKRAVNSHATDVATMQASRNTYSSGIDRESRDRYY